MVEGELFGMVAHLSLQVLGSWNEAHFTELTGYPDSGALRAVEVRLEPDARLLGHGSAEMELDAPEVARVVLIDKSLPADRAVHLADPGEVTREYFSSPIAWIWGARDENVIVLLC